MRIVSNKSFFPSGATYQVLAGNARTGAFFLDVTCAASGGIITCPSVTLDATTNSSVPSATYSVYLFDALHLRGVFLENIKVPHTLGTTITWAQISAYTKTAPRPLPATYYTADQVNALLAVVGGGGAGGVMGSYTQESLPTTGTSAGSLALVTNKNRGLWRYDGAKWIAVDANNRVNLLDYCTPVGTSDNTACINAAIQDVNTRGGGTIVVPQGYTFYHSGTISLDSTFNVSFEGANTSKHDGAANFMYTGAGVKGWSLYYTFGVSFKNLSIMYNNATFTGYLMRFGYGQNNNGISQRNSFYECFISGTPTARFAKALINTHGTILTKIEDSHLQYAVKGIKGINTTLEDGDNGAAIGESVVTQIINTDFNFIQGPAIYNPDASWSITNGNSFEPDLNGQVIALDSDGNYYIRALKFEGNWLGDAYSPTQPAQIKLRRVLGGSVSDNWFTLTYNGLGIELIGTQGVRMAGNRFETEESGGTPSSVAMKISANIEACYATTITGNSMNVVTPILDLGSTGITVLMNEKGGSVLANQISYGLLVSGNPGTNPVGASITEIGFGTVQAASPYTGQSGRTGGGIRMSNGSGFAGDGAMVFSVRELSPVGFQFWNGGKLLDMSGNGMITGVPLTVGTGNTPIAGIRHGVTVLVAGVKIINDATITANSEIYVQPQIESGTPGIRYSVTRSVGASFTITSKTVSNTVETGDVSTVAYHIIQP